MLASGQVVALHPSSVLCGKRPACIVYDELLRTTRDYARQACIPSGHEGGMHTVDLITHAQVMQDMQQSACIIQCIRLLHILLALVYLYQSCARAGNCDRCCLVARACTHILCPECAKRIASGCATCAGRKLKRPEH